MGVLNKNTSYLADFVTHCCIGPMWSPSIVLGVVHQPATEQVNQLLYMGTTHCKYHAINLSLNTSEIYFNLTTEYINQMHNILAYIPVLWPLQGYHNQLPLQLSRYQSITITITTTDLH